MSRCVYPDPRFVVIVREARHADRFARGLKTRAALHALRCDLWREWWDWLRPRLAPTIVQHKHAGGGSGSATLTWTSSTTAGNLLVLYAGASRDIAATDTISTPTGYTKVVGPGSSTVISGYVFYKENAASQASVTVSAAHSDSVIVTFGVEVGGDLNGATSTLDKSALNNGASASWDSGTTASTTQAAEIWIAGLAGVGTSAPSSVSNSFAIQETITNQQSGGGDNQVSGVLATKIVAATGAADTTGSGSSNTSWQGGIATFKGTAAASAKLFLQSLLNGLGAGGPFFANPLG